MKLITPTKEKYYHVPFSSFVLAFCKKLYVSLVSLSLTRLFSKLRKRILIFYKKKRKSHVFCHLKYKIPGR